MFRRATLHLFAALLLSAVSCSFDEEQPQAAVSLSGEVIISASLEVQQDITRTSLDSEGKVRWTDGDAFALLTAGSRDRFELVEGAGKAIASFSGSTSGKGPFLAFYPYSESCSIEDGALCFSLPQEQTYVDGTFAACSSPALAKLAAATDAAYFRNLCGVLQLNLCGSGNVKYVEVVNLDGTPLWGDCAVALDGKEGTDDQTMTVTGGSNIIKIVFPSEVTLKAASPKVIDVVVPSGAFARGFSVRVLDARGEAVSFLTAQNEKVKIERSFITAMDQLRIPSNGESLDTCFRGFYKDVFMDGGVSLTSRTTLPACQYLGWTLDFMATSDSLFQERVVVKSGEDANGVILYPDSSPRYRMVYMNGGKANAHAKSLTTVGRNRYVNFVNHGGCYVGSCAGAFIAHKESSTYKYLGLIPASMTSSGLSDSETGMAIPKDSPLLKYYDFGGDFYVAGVRHNGGGYMTKENLPENGEILATFVKDGWKMNGNGSIWSYKSSRTKGRVLVTGSHPEGVESGERLDLMAAMMLYSTEGLGEVSPKARLLNGVERKNNKTTGVNAGIGDKQYHHFIVTIPEGARNVKIYLDGDSDLDLHLAMRKGNLAWRTEADFLLVQAGCRKTLEFDTLSSGDWYISVFCPAEVKTVCGEELFLRTGDLKALNGVPYSIEAVWE